MEQPKLDREGDEDVFRAVDLDGKADSWDGRVGRLGIGARAGLGEGVSEQAVVRKRKVTGNLLQL